MIYESGSEKEKKVQPSDRTSDELEGEERERERREKWRRTSETNI